RWEDAAARWRRTLELAPDEPRAMMSAARAELWVEADDAADQLVDAIRWMVRGGELSHELGLLYLGEGRLGHAASLLAEAVRERPADAAARFALAVALSQLGHDEAALAELELIGPEHALWVEARVRIGHLLLSTGRFDRARLAADVGLAKRPGAPELVHFLALVHERSGRVDEALRLLRDARKAAPAELELAEAEAGILLRTGDRDRGTRVLRSAVEAAGATTEDGLYRLGAFLHRAGEVDGAVEIMQRIMREHPASTRAPAFLGWHWVERGVRLDDAERLLRGALALEPRSGAILDSLGWLAFKRGRLAEAERLLTRASRLMPTDPDVAERLGDVLVEAGETQHARARYVHSRDILARAVTAREPDAASAHARVQQKLAGIPGPALAEP
ncbi:tetratricopeptide repeat protein, partial [Myxococcota bacterium]|nr:tetratricopeptide repeat protein [Myxococcota bacterium]